MTCKFLPTTILSLIGLVSCQKQTEQPNPNIIFILADDMGFETLKAYGGSSYNTPNLDKLSAEGMTFNYCYANPLVSKPNDRHHNRFWCKGGHANSIDQYPG